jgi:DNA invertase Pin-like site-specific DNA recombinase
LNGYRERQLRAFHELDRERQAMAIRRMAADGHGDDTIASATGLSREQVRRILSEHEGPA